MARLILGSYLVRYPLGGMMSWVLQYLVGLHRLGHEIYFVEKSGYPNSCFDLARGIMTDDCSYGAAVVQDLLARFGLGERWCYVDAAGTYHGLSRQRIESIFRSADAFIDMGTHGAWLEEASGTRVRALLDGEPGFTQMKMQKRLDAGQILPRYDAYFTTGWNIGTAASDAPVAGKRWQHVFHPVVCDLFPVMPAPGNGAFTTVMNWQSYEPLEYRGATYGHKDVEFARFLDLPRRTSAVLEAAVWGKEVPSQSLRERGWRIVDSHQVTRSFDSFVEYLGRSRGEFGVCKSGYVVSRSGWFSDRSAAYLASGRPVVLQDTGFSAHLPCGQGLFAVQTVDEAAAAIETIVADYPRHARAARQVAEEHLSSDKVLSRFLHELGVGPISQGPSGLPQHRGS